MSGLAFVRLLQLASPALPVGGYSYSQGLEQAVHCGIVVDAVGAERWIGGALTFGVARWEAPAVAVLHRAWQQGDDDTVARIDREFVASRETAELRAETLQMGHSLVRLLVELDPFVSAPGYRARLAALHEAAYPTAWSAAAAAFAVPVVDAIRSYLWTWLENQVLAALKAMPIGQSAGQRLLARLAERIPALADQSCACDEADFGNWTPGLALASAAHETQYSRLFRS